MERKFWKIGTLFVAVLVTHPYIPHASRKPLGAAAQDSPRTTLQYAAIGSAGRRGSRPTSHSRTGNRGRRRGTAGTVRTEVVPGAAVSGAELRPALTKELEAMKQRIAELEAEIQSSGATATDAATALQGAKTNLGTPTALQEGNRQAAPLVATPASPDLPAEVTTKSLPFAFADWTWLNGNARTKEAPLDSKFFTPEIRADVNYVYDFNHPKDDTIGGSSESSALMRSSKQFSVGGDSTRTTCAAAS